MFLNTNAPVDGFKSNVARESRLAPNELSARLEVNRVLPVTCTSATLTPLGVVAGGIELG